VPYKGATRAATDIAGGQIPVGFQGLGTVAALVRGGQLRLIGVCTQQRLSQFADVPTVDESGVPGYVAVIHYGMVAPAGLDRAIGEKLNGALNAALDDAQVRARIADEGGSPLAGTRDAQARDIDAEETKWGAVVRQLGIRVE